MKSTSPRKDDSARLRMVKGRGTGPELRVLEALKSLRKSILSSPGDLPGKPDIVLRNRKIILVHGCFWHQHKNCRFAQQPKSNLEYWTDKFACNKRRDRRVARALRHLGFEVLTIWECQTRDQAALRLRLGRLLRRPRPR